MRLPNSLRALRGDRNLAELARLAGTQGVTAAELSKIERGHELPRDEWREGLERAYGAPAHVWYPPEVLLVIERDEETHRG